jgi:glycosyl transferase family 2
MKRPRAIFTMVYNESVFLPLWLKYYSQFFAPEDTYILDHGSTDGSTDCSGFNREIIPASDVDATRQRDMVQQKQHDLITQYDVVLYTDVDEFVVPEMETLGEYIDRFGNDYINCNGYEILHLKDIEPPLDVTRPIMQQRSHWFPCDMYMSKPLLARIPMEWDLGCHSTPKGKKQDKSLYLIHMHRVDYELCLSRHRQLLVRPQCQTDIHNGWSFHRRIIDPDHFEKWFYKDSGAQDYVTIPEVWKSVKL